MLQHATRCCAALCFGQAHGGGDIYPEKMLDMTLLSTSMGCYLWAVICEMSHGCYLCAQPYHLWIVLPVTLPFVGCYSWVVIHNPVIYHAFELVSRIVGMLLRRIVGPAQATHLSMGLGLRPKKTAPSMFAFILFSEPPKSDLPHADSTSSNRALAGFFSPGRGKGTRQKPTFPLGEGALKMVRITLYSQKREEKAINYELLTTNY